MPFKGGRIDHLDPSIVIPLRSGGRWDNVFTIGVP